jgi:Ser/Thr protein kinase RdoA (MazF antagonist)
MAGAGGVGVKKAELWRKSAADSGRPELGSADVQRLIEAVAPGSRATDLGGTMSLNVELRPAGLVLRVHRPFVSRLRLDALQDVRRHIADRGLRAAAAVPWRGATLFRCGGRWAELEPYLPSERPAATPDAYVWMFGAMGTLHRELAAVDLAVPRPVLSTYGPPSSLRRWLPIAERAVRHDSEAADVVGWLGELVGRLRARWVPATHLPQQLIHGDVRLGNVRRAPDGEPVYFDFGFLARRPRVHELAYALAWMLLRPDSQGTAEGFAWGTLPRLIAAYEQTSGTTLTTAERRALAPYTAAVPLYLSAIAGFMPDPAAHLRNETRRRFLRIAEWLLAHPDAVL